ncbi:MAG: Ig-like domain-containing protein, partial [Thermoplasmata archaeon]|nr:Ig-like domain-containing protein [Thermoplasmata archaeon]
GGWATVWTSPKEVGLHHYNDFVQCTSYTVNVTQARDLGGKNLEPGPVPNPWNFMTACGNPYIADTYPADGAEDWAVNATIYIVFSKFMDTSSVTWEIDPDPGIWSEKWEYAVLMLTPLQILYECTDHTLEVTYARDQSGNELVPGPVPNPFTFRTVCIHPIILWTEPADKTQGVALDAPIFVKWNEPMNVTSFTWETAPDIDLNATWSPSEDLVTLTHDEDFIGGIEYTVYVDGYDKEGNQWRPSPSPNPWRFTTVPADNPYLLYKDPDVGDQGVPFFKNITLIFSKPMNQSTVTWSLTPSLNLTPSWSNNSTHLVLSHTDPFIECAIYDFKVDGYDWQGLRLAPPKVWWFAVACFRPYIMSTSPAHQEFQVPLNETIVVEFSETINETTLDWGIVPDPGGWTVEWNWNSSIAYF